MSVVLVMPLVMKKKISQSTLLFLLSMSVGVLLATVFTDFLPEVFEESHGLEGPIIILVGFLLMFILEKFVHYHHNRECEHDEHKHAHGDSHGHGHGHAYHLASVNLVGDGLHNFIDGLVIAGAYAVSIPLGISATIAIMLHELPQEIADFGVLVYSGMSKKKALIFNFLSAITAIVGTLIGLFLVGRVEGFVHFIIPFAAGNFLYIAASNLLPQLHRHCELKETLVHLIAIVIGITFVVLVGIYGPGHVHL